MRVTCPHCKKDVTLDDKSAEMSVPCPLCGNIFTAPSLMMALPDEPIAAAPPPVATPAPPAVVSVPPAPKVESAAPAPQVTPAQSVRLTIKKAVVTWLGPVALVLLFFLSFFNWVGAYPAGNALYTQSAWQLISGGFTADAAGEEVFGREADLRKVGGFSFTMLLTLILLIVAAIIAGLDLAEEYVTFAVPDIIQKVWPHRLTFLAVVSLIIFGFLSALCLSGFGMETMVPVMAEQVVKASEPKPSPDAPETTKTKTTHDLRVAREVAQMGVKRTWGWRLGYAMSALAVVGFGLEMMLRRRGRRPEPVLELHF